LEKYNRCELVIISEHAAAGQYPSCGLLLSASLCCGTLPVGDPCVRLWSSVQGCFEVTRLLSGWQLVLLTLTVMHVSLRTVQHSVK
jgi:hypothetical protein